MIYTIENEFLRVSAEDDGAQLSSVELKENGKEFLRRMVHGRLFVFLYCRCINSYLNKTKRKLLFKSFLYSMK